MSATNEANMLLRITGTRSPGPAGPAAGERNPITAYVADVIRHAEPTPVVDIGAVVGGRTRTISLKLDGCSRWGSIKGRTALALLASIADRVDSRSTVVESTSGNLGVALAGICRDLGIPFTAVVDSRLPPAMSVRLSEYGARIDEVERSDDGRHLQRRLARVQEILRGDAHALWTNQYENPASVAVHRWWTGPELAGQLRPDLQAVFAPVSTGGSFAGLSAFLAEHRPEVVCTAVDVQGSTIFGGPPGPRLLTGIGASKPSAFLGGPDRPPHVMVADIDAIAVCRTLARDVGISVGGSSGATIAGCLRVLSERPDITHALCLCPDMASNYTETLYDDAWLRQAGAQSALNRPPIGGQEVHFTEKPQLGDPEDEAGSHELDSLRG
jgi:N-(2-amino-2-carboxyethyl)-L-glutamate synthase